MPPSNIIISSQTSTLTGKRRRLGNLLWMKTVSRRGKRTRMSQVRKVHRFRRREPATTQGIEGKVVPWTKEKFPWFPFFCSIVFESPLHPLFSHLFPVFRPGCFEFPAISRRHHWRWHPFSALRFRQKRCKNLSLVKMMPEAEPQITSYWHPKSYNVLPPQSCLLVH